MSWRHEEAHRFACHLSLDALRLALNEQGPWAWIPRDNESWGEYISTKVGDTFIKIIPEPSHNYGLSVRFSSVRDDAAARVEWQTLRSILHDRLLAKVGAQNVTQATLYER